MTDITENGKYYIPDIKDFHEGFEYEYKDEGASLDGKQEWQQKVFNLRSAGSFDDGFMIGWYIDKGLSRVKRLDHDDIESLGWVCDNEGKTAYRMNGCKFNLHIQGDYDGSVMFRINAIGGQLFFGTIRNKSELRLIMKMVGITA